MRRRFFRRSPCVRRFYKALSVRGYDLLRNGGVVLRVRLPTLPKMPYTLPTSSRLRTAPRRNGLGGQTLTGSSLIWKLISELYSGTDYMIGFSFPYLGTQVIDSVWRELNNSLGGSRNTNGRAQIRIFAYAGCWRYRFRNDPVALRATDPSLIFGQ